MLSQQQQDVPFPSSKREFSWQCHWLFFCFCLPHIFSHRTQSWVPLPYCVARNHHSSLFPLRWSAVYRAKSLEGQDWKTDRVKRCIFRWDQMKTRKHKVDTETDAWTECANLVVLFSGSKCRRLAGLQAGSSSSHDFDHMYDRPQPQACFLGRLWLHCLPNIKKE